MLYYTIVVLLVLWGLFAVDYISKAMKRGVIEI